MKQLIKNCLVFLADWVFRCRGLRFPAYVSSRNRLDLLLAGNEQDVVRLMKRRLQPGMCVLDVGANIGLISRVCACKVGRSGRVIAFEPDPYTREFLAFNVKRFSNVTISAIALSDSNEVAQLHLHPGSGTSNSLLNFDSQAATLEVECQTIDAFLETHPEVLPDFIKIDVEGAEPKVLAGLRQTLERLPGVALVIEFCPENLANGNYLPADYYALLDGMDMAVEIIGKDGGTEPVNGLGDLQAKLGGAIYCNLFCHRKR